MTRALEKGLLVVISAPSGGGKTTIIRQVLASMEENTAYSISATTRRRRVNEVDSQDYYFLSDEDFWDKCRNGKFVEWAEVHGNYYATPKEPLEKWLAEGRLIFLDLDVDGGVAVKNHFEDGALLIFVKPPSFESLIARLKKRNTETEAEIKKRMERYPKEIKKSKMYDHSVLNENLESTVSQIIQIISHHYDLNPMEQNI